MKKHLYKLFGKQYGLHWHYIDLKSVCIKSKDLRGSWAYFSNFHFSPLLVAKLSDCKLHHLFFVLAVIRDLLLTNAIFSRQIGFFFSFL